MASAPHYDNQAQGWASQAQDCYDPFNMDNFPPVRKSTIIFLTGFQLMSPNGAKPSIGTNQDLFTKGQLLRYHMANYLNVPLTIAVTSALFPAAQAEMPIDDTQGPARFYYDMSLYTGPASGIGDGRRLS